jgi:hypothetical protein
MPHRFAKAHFVRGPQPLGFFSGKEIRHLKPFFPDLLVDAQRTLKYHSTHNLDHFAEHDLLIARRELRSDVGRERVIKPYLAAKGIPWN